MCQIIINCLFTSLSLLLFSTTKKVTKKVTGLSPRIRGRRLRSLRGIISMVLHAQQLLLISHRCKIIHLAQFAVPVPSKSSNAGMIKDMYKAFGSLNSIEEKQALSLPYALSPMLYAPRPFALNSPKNRSQAGHELFRKHCIIMRCIIRVY